MNAFVPLAAEAVEESFPSWVWGAGALAGLLILLVITLLFGWGRPHS